MKGLGRRVEFDERSRQFPIRTLIRGAPQPRSYTWKCPVTLDQGFEGACVGHAFAHEAAARPVKVRDISEAIATEVYSRARQLDQWEGENYDGTSILAGAKACVERGWYREYRWAFNFEDVLLTLGYRGPVVLGLNWYEGMAEVDERGFLQVAGRVLGGHAILANGVNLSLKAVRLHNSWGPGWGHNGEAFISFDDLRRLLSEDGEACIPIGRKIPLVRRLMGWMLNRLQIMNSNHTNPQPKET